MNNTRPGYLLRCLFVLTVSLLLLSCSKEGAGSSTSLVADESRYVSDLMMISQAPRSGVDENHQKVQDLCASRFTELGYTVERQDFGGGVNVIGTIPGTLRPEEAVLVSAHYDSIPNGNGADDNASGVAALLESARLLSAQKHDRTLIVACWDQEEPAITGSYMYATRARKNNTQITVAYVYDEIGYTDDQENSQEFPAGFDVVYPMEALKMRANKFRADFILLVFDSDASQWADAIAKYADREKLKSMQLEVDLNGDVSGHLRGSDHQSFWDQGYPAIEITDTAGNRNPYKHSKLDTINTLDHDFSVKVISAVTASLQTALDP